MRIQGSKTTAGFRVEKACFMVPSSTETEIVSHTDVLVREANGFGGSDPMETFERACMGMELVTVFE